MGRVARYKKGKASLNSYAGSEYTWGTGEVSTKKKKRSLTAEKHRTRKLKRRKGIHDDGGFDLPPEGDDFDMSDFVVKKQKKKSLDDLLGPPQKHKTVVPSNMKKASDDHPTGGEEGNTPVAKITNDSVRIGNITKKIHIPLDDKEELRAAKLLKLDPKTGKSLSKANTRETKIEGRRPGESMNAFKRRLKDETQIALANNYKKTKESEADIEKKLEKAQRKKEYARLRKLKKKGKLATSDDDVDDFNDDLARLRAQKAAKSTDGFITGEEAVRFLEQAAQPPIFNQLPRGANNKLKLKMKGVKGDKKPGLDEEKIEAEQNAMEIMRRKVQAQYALMKAKRKQEGGNFHL